MEDLNVVPEKGHAPLFDVLIALQNNEDVKEERYAASNLKVSEFESPYQFSKFDLTFNFNESKEGLILALEYSTELFSANKIERMLGHFEELIQSILKEGSQKINELDYVTVAEKEEILNQLVGTSQPLSSGQTIPCLLYTSPSPRDQRGSRMPSSA